MDTFLMNSLIREMEQTLDLTRILQCSLVQRGDYSDVAAKESAKGLSEEIRQSCKDAISLLNSWKASDNNAAARVKRKGDIEFAGRDAAPADIDQIRDPKRRCSSSSSSSSVRKEVTVAPHYDGHQWRKYGEKNIKGSFFKRSYYRCTYSADQRCKAKKKVQQQDSSSYLVIREGQHTCSNNSSSSNRHGAVPPPSFPPAAAAAAAATTTSSAPTGLSCCSSSSLGSFELEELLGFDFDDLFNVLNNKQGLEDFN